MKRDYLDKGRSPLDEYTITDDQWEEFRRQRETPEFQVQSIRNITVHHYCGFLQRTDKIYFEFCSRQKVKREERRHQKTSTLTDSGPAGTRPQQ